MRAEIIIQGLVQGVGYRFFVIEQARDFHVNGYVRNLPDGRVEVVAEADKGILNDFINMLKIGPPPAHIAGIDVKWHEEDIGFTDFGVKF